MVISINLGPLIANLVTEISRLYTNQYQLILFSELLKDKVILIFKTIKRPWQYRTKRWSRTKKISSLTTTRTRCSWLLKSCNDLKIYFPNIYIAYRTQVMVSLKELLLYFFPSPIPSKVLYFVPIMENLLQRSRLWRVETKSFCSQNSIWDQI